MADGCAADMFPIMSKPAGKKKTAQRSQTEEPQLADGYLAVSRRPLQMLAFLLPLIIGYEIALSLLLRHDNEIITNLAHKTLIQFFNVFGMSHSGGLLLGGILIVVVLLVWHVLARDPWHVDFTALGLMALESAALVVPLLALGRILGNSFSSVALATVGAPSPAGGAAPVDVAGLDLVSRVAISVGAGLYEELAFRMLLIAALHTLFVDLGKMSHMIGASIAVILAAGAFTWYHPLGGPSGEVSMARLTFFFLAGLYFGIVYVLRGFGIVVAVHALYDIITISALAP